MRNFNLISSEAICAELGARIRTQRLAQNITKQELARMTASSLSSIHRAEAGGHMTLDLFVRVAQSLHVLDTLDDLLIQEMRSIKEIEAQYKTSLRQRARHKTLKV